MSTKPKVDTKNTKVYAHMAPDTRNIYIGAGPRLSLDQKINFINENNCLAKRITEVGNRQEFMSGILDSNSKKKSYLNSSRSKSSLNSSYVKLPGIDHQVGSLNGEKRKRDFQHITRFNLIMAKKLIDTKSVISYDELTKHNKFVSKLFIFPLILSLQHNEMKKRIGKGHIRAEGYSMLGKSHSNFS